VSFIIFCEGDDSYLQLVIDQPTVFWITIT